MPPTELSIGITPLQIGILVVYSLGLVGIAFALRKLNTSSDDYFRAGCQGSWWLVGMSSYMMSFSAYTFTGLAGVAYEAGFSSWTEFFGNIFGFALAGAFAAAWMRQLRVTTPADVVRERFGTKTEQLYGWHGALFGLLYSGLTLFGVSIFASTVFGLPVQTMIWGIGITVLLYSLVGGRWAVMGTDFAQGIILVSITFLAGFLALKHIGGVSGLLESIQENQLEDTFKMIKPVADPETFPGDPRKYTWTWVLATVFGLTLQRLSLGSAPHYFSARDEHHAKKAAWFVCIMMILSTVIFFIPAMVARLEFSELVQQVDIAKPAEASYAIICMQLLPESLMGLMIIAIFAATMSAMDSGLNQLAAVVVNNIYPTACKVLKKTPKTGPALLRIGQITTLCSGATIIGLAIYFSNVDGKGSFELLLDIGALIGTPMGPAMIMGMFCRKQPSYAAFISIVAGFALALITKFTDMAYDVRVFSTFGVGAVSFYLTRFLPEDPQEVKERIKAFYTRMHTPVDFEKEVGSLEGVRLQAKVMSLVSLCVGGLVLLLMFFTDGWGLNGKTGVLIISAFALTIGFLLRLYVQDDANFEH